MKRITWQDIADILDPYPVKSVPKRSTVPPPQKSNAPVKSNHKAGQQNVKITVPVVVLTPKEPAIITPPKPITVINSVTTPHIMNSDSFFVIGSDHDICQDYVANHNNGVKSYIVLADGCSGSKDSDVGARILVKTHELYIPAMGVMDFDEFSKRSRGLYTQIIEEAQSNSKALELDPMALDATLMSIISNKSGEFMVTCYGDGVVAFGRRDGIIETYSVSYKEGYPNYVSYQLSPERKAKFDEKANNYKEVTLELIDEDKAPLKQKYRSSAPFETYLGSKDKYLWVAVMSDGVQSFMEKVSDSTSITKESVPTHEVIRELFAFKSFTGSFVKRRMKRFLETCKERQWTHSDDLSVGVVYLGEEN